MKRKYPTLHEQSNLVREQTRQHVGFDAENIEKSLSFKLSDKAKDKTKKEEESKIKGNKLLKRRQNVDQKAEVKETSARNKSSPAGKRQQQNQTPPGLEGYDLKEDYKTSPPVGWKRPPSQATMLARSIYEKTAGKSDEAAKRSKTDREVFLEAIYREDSTGKIFMKYLSSKNKLVCIKFILKHTIISIKFDQFQ